MRLVMGEVEMEVEGGGERFQYVAAPFHSHIEVLLDLVRDEGVRRDEGGR